MSETRTIRWRPELESFLPPLDTRDLRVLLRREGKRHLRGLREGTIIPHKEYWDRFMVEQRDEQGRTVWRTKPEGEGYLRDYESLGEIDQRLRERYGSWIPPTLASSAFARLRPSDTIPDHVIDGMIESIVQLHQQTDRFLHQLYQRFDLHQPRSLEDALMDANRFIARSAGEQEGFDDRWFHDVGRRGALLLESMGCRVTAEEIEDLADAHFHSWIAPEPDALDAFATEVALLGVERMFEERYGPPA